MRHSSHTNNRIVATRRTKWYNGWYNNHLRDS